MIDYPDGVFVAGSDRFTGQHDSAILGYSLGIPLKQPTANNLRSLSLSRHNHCFTQAIEHFLEALLVGFILLALQGVSELIKRVAFLKGLIDDPGKKKQEKSAEEELAEAILATQGDKK